MIQGSLSRLAMMSLFPRLTIAPGSYLNKYLLRWFMVFSALLVGNPIASLADTESEPVLAVKLGYTYNQTWFDVFTSDRGAPEGKLVDDANQGLFLSMNSPYRYFSGNDSTNDWFNDSNAGYYWEIGYQHYRYDKQDIGKHDVDLGTSVEGNYFYLAPVLIYNYDKSAFRDGNASILGIGLGLGYLRADGDIVFTETTNQTFHVNVNRLGMTYFLLYEYQLSHWFVRLRAGGPVVSGDPYNYGIFEYSVDLGRSFVF